MSKKNTKSSAEKIILVLGLDEDGKPHAGRFTVDQSTLVNRAVEAMRLSAYEVEPASLGELLPKIPAGRLYSNGKGFIPFVRRDRFSKLLHALGLPESTFVKSPAEEMPIASGLPADFESLSVGNLVLATEGDKEGWWEAIITETAGEMLTLRFRDYPKQPKVQRHRTAIALINPSHA